MSVNTAVDRYSLLFANKTEPQLFLSAILRINELSITNGERSVSMILSSFGRIYFKDINNTIDTIINNVVKCVDRAIDSTVESICIDWDDIKTNTNTSIFKHFYYSDCEFINIEMIKRFYPNAKEIRMMHIKLSMLTFDHIFDALAGSGNKINSIYIALQFNPNQPDDIQIISESCKALTCFDGGNIFENDWKSFSKLYELRHVIQQTDDEQIKKQRLYHLDVLIASYAVFKNKHRFEAIGYYIRNNVFHGKETASRSTELYIHNMPFTISPILRLSNDCY
eukprot:279641_1